MQKCKKVVYELESNSETENIEKETLESGVEEIEEEQQKYKQPWQYTTEKKLAQQTGEKRKLNIFNYLNSEQDAKKNRN